MYFDIPKICIEAATPANSAATFPISTMSPATITKNVGRNPNSSRIKSDRPLPVTTPIRAHISSVTYNAIVMGISDHNSAYPYCAPACVYTEIPPASLSTLEVINPGPITASSNVRRCRSARRRFCKLLPRDFTASTRVVIASQFIGAFSISLFLHQPRHHVIHRDGANRPALAVRHRQHAQVVFIEQLKDVAFVRIPRDAEQRLRLQLGHTLLRVREE